MPIVPAICDQCGTVFAAPFQLQTGAQVGFTNVGSGPCPRCGSMGTIPDGLYEAFGDTLRILPRSASSLARLAAAVRSAQEQGMDREAAAAAIENEAPEFAALASDVRERSGWNLNLWLMFLLALITLLVTSGEAISNTLSNQELDHLFQEFVQAHPVLAPSPTSTANSQSAMQPPAKVRKNELCPCGSGKRYRRCHGRP
jgi:SEC-C motif